MPEIEPDYTACSLEELADVTRHINREAHPERWAMLQAEMHARRAVMASEGKPASPLWPWVRIIAAYEFVQGLQAIGGLFARDASVWEVGAAVLIAAWSFVAGWLVWKGRRPGFGASLLLQGVLVPQVSVPALTISTTLGATLLVGVMFPGRQAIHPFAALLFGSRIILTPEQPFSYAGANLLPVVIAALLIARIHMAEKLLRAP